MLDLLLLIIIIIYKQMTFSSVSKYFSGLYACSWLSECILWFTVYLIEAKLNKLLAWYLGKK